MDNTNYWALLANFNIPTTYKINRTWWSLESHGSHTVNGVQLIPGAPGFNPKYAYMMWDALFNVPAVQAATPLTLTGNNGNDTLTGGTENDTFTGGSGADSLIGGGGNDLFNVTTTADDGNDTINGGAGTDTIAVAAGQTIVFAANDANITLVENITLGAGASVTLTGQTEAFTITGSTGNETVVGGSGNDTITGGAGADSINAGAGTNTITDAGPGADTITHNAAASTVAIAVTGTGTVTLAASQDGATANSNAGVNTAINASTSTAAVTLNGNTGNDSLTGGSGADTLSGGAGNDTISAGAGADSITGGGGADTIDVGNNDAAVDTVVLAAAADSYVGAITSGTTNLSASIDVVSNLAVDDRFDLTALGLNTSVNGAAVTSNLAAVTTAGSWGLIRGTYVAGVFTQNTGTDTHTLLVYDADGAGADTNLGAVVLVGLFGASAVNGMVTLSVPLGFNITGTAGNDNLIGTAFADTIAGVDGNDTITAGDGNDTITGGSGADSLSGGDGNDTFNVTTTANDGNDTINGGAGTDTIAVAAGQTIVFAAIASDANITLVENITLGAGASVTLTGQTEGFTITGSTGNETVVGGSGNDTITGGAGVDRFVFARSGLNNGLDTITDFVAGAAGDILDFEAFLSGPSTGVFNALSGGVYTSLAAAKTGVLDANKLSVNAIANRIIILKGDLNEFDTSAKIADLFDTALDNNGILSGTLNVSPKAVLIIGADNGTEFIVAYVSNSTVTGIQDTEVRIAGMFTGATADAVDLFALSNFFLA